MPGFVDIDSMNMQQLTVAFYEFHIFTLNTQFLWESGNVKSVSVVKTKILACNYCSLGFFCESNFICSAFCCIWGLYVIFLICLLTEGNFYHLSLSCFEIYCVIASIMKLGKFYEWWNRDVVLTSYTCPAFL